MNTSVDWQNKVFVCSKGPTGKIGRTRFQSATAGASPCRCAGFASRIPRVIFKVMTDPGWISTHLLAELKRRHVFRVFAVYCAVAFLLLQIMDLVVPALLLPDWTYRLVAFILALGLPIVLITAWAFEITPDGVKRTEPAEETSAATGSAARGYRLVGTTTLVVLVLVFGGWWLERQRESRQEGTSVEDGPVSVAVLPFVNMSSDAEQEYFSDGVSEELLNLLARLGTLRVTARTSSFAFKGQGLTAEQLGDTLRVRYLVEGSVRKDGDLVRVTAQLIETENGSHLWSETWTRRLADIFAVQDEIAADVADQLQVTLLGGAPAVEETDAVAYGLVLRARHLADQNTLASIEAAEALYEEALAIDPEYATGWSGLAGIYIRAAYLANQPSFEPSFARAVRAAERALEIDPAHAPALGVLGGIAEARGDLAGAARYYEQALALDPDDATIYRAARLLASLGRLGEAVELREYLVARDPVGHAAHAGLGRMYLVVGRTAEAVAELRMAATLNPEAAGLWSGFGEALLYDGKADEALVAVQREPSEIWRLIGLSEVHHALGRAQESDEALRTLMERHEHGWAFNIAYVLAYRGQVDRAFEWLDRAVAYGDPGLAEVFQRPQLANLQDDPRWPAFLARIGKSPDELAAIEFRVATLRP